MRNRSYYIVKIESYDGEDTFIHCGNDTQDYLYCVAAAGDSGLEIVDNGYRTVEEAADAWPEAIKPAIG
jgi:hypothetical protein